MRRGLTAAISTHSRATRLVPLIAFLLAASGASLLASSEASFNKSASKLKAIEVVSGPQLDQARRAYPGRVLQLSGVITGISRVDDKMTLILELVDGATICLDCRPDHPEIQPKARVRCLAQPLTGSYRSALDLLDITAERTPFEVLQGAARAALKIPPADPDEIARSAAEVRRSMTDTPTRAGDRGIICKRAIAYFNPKLTARELDTITESILHYCDRYHIDDPYMVVAIIAAESRFNPKARSYKGAMGLGQLMPATAAAHGVDAWDPVANLETAVRILRSNLDKYNGDWLRALAAYNAGSGAVKRYGGVPPYRETREYLWRIYEYWCWLHGTQPEPRPR
jgi:hypothetical protein